MERRIAIQKLEASHIPRLVAAFEGYGGDRTEEKFRRMLRSQKLGALTGWVVLADEEIAGYVTVIWRSCLRQFKERDIPEISDLNILSQFRRRRLATYLLDRAEDDIMARSAVAGIGVGLTEDYGPAQALYVRRGYLPLGIGLTYDYEPVRHGERVIVDDDLVFWLTKRLR